MSGTFYLSSAGERWPTDLAGRVARFVFEAGLNRASRLQLTIRNEAHAYQDHPLLAEGAELVVQFGTAAHTTRRNLTIHQVTGINPLLVPAYGHGADLGDAPAWRLYASATYSEVAAHIARLRGIEAKVAPDPVRRPQVAQAGETDGRFLARLAAEIGWEFWVEGRVLHFRPPDYGARPVALLSRGGNLAEFAPQERTLMAPGEVVVRTFNLANKEFAELTINQANAARAVLGPAALRVPSAGRLVTWTAAQDRGAGLAVARGAFEALERATVTARFRAAGHPDLMPGAIVEVRGHGVRWDGLYRIAQVRHQLAGSDYTVEGSLQRNAAGLVGQRQASAGVANTHRAEDGRPFAVVRVVDLATGQEREEEAR